MFIFAILASTLPARAEILLLENGDQLTGAITRTTPEAVSVRSPLLGELTVPRSAIKAIVNEGPATPGQTVPPSAAVAAVTPPASTSPAAVAATVPATAPARGLPDLERYYLPLGPHWKNQLAVGVISTTGNTDKSQISAEVTFNYLDQPNELTFKIGGAYAETEGVSNTELAFADVIYRRMMPELGSDRWFFFAESRNLYDGVKGISFRTIDDLGLGYYLWRTDRFSVDLRAGPGVTYVRPLEGEESTDLTAVAGLRITWTPSSRLKISEDLLHTHGITDTERYQTISETAALFKLPELQRGLGLKLAYQLDYDSTAVAPRKDLDTRFILALTLEF